MGDATAEVVLQAAPEMTRTRRSGWRSICEFEGVTFGDGATLVGFEAQFLDDDQLRPGQAARCRLRFWAGHLMPPSIPPGTRVTIREGVKVVATGELLSYESSGVD